MKKSFTFAIALIILCGINLSEVSGRQIVRLGEKDNPALQSFFENFDNAIPPTLPTEWTGIVQSTAAMAAVETTTTNVAFSAPNHVRLQNNNDLNALLVLSTPLVKDFGSNWLTFYCKMGGSNHTEEFVIGYTTDPNDQTTFVGVDTLIISGNAYTRITYEFPETFTDADEYHIAFKSNFNSTYKALYLDDIRWESKPTGAVFSISPDLFAWQDIFINDTSPTATFTISNLGTSNLDFADGSIILTGENAELFNLIIDSELVFPLSIEPNTSFQIQASFSPQVTGTFNAGISFTTGGNTYVADLVGTAIDPTVTPTVFYDFIGSFPPLHWTRHEGELTESTTLVNGFTWGHAKFANQVDLPENNSARMVMFGNRNSWLVTPPIDLGDGNNGYELHFDLAVTGHNNTNPATFGPNQSLSVVVSPDAGQTWVPANTLQTWNAENSNIPVSGEHVIIDLSDYSGTVKIGFYARARTPDPNFNIFVANVGIYENEQPPLSEFFEDFTQVTPPTLPEGWSKVVESSATNSDVQSTVINLPLSSPNHVRWINGSDVNAQLILATPNVTDFGSNWLTFFVKSGSANYNPELIIGYTPDPNDPDEFVFLDTLIINSNAYYWTYYEFPDILTDNDQYHIILKAGFDSTNRALYMDNISWNEKPDGPLFSATPSSYTWTSVFVNETSQNVNFNIFNFGVSDIVIQQEHITLTGEDASIFGLEFPTSVTFPVTLEPGQSFPIQANVSPVDEGVFSADISINWEGEIKLIPLEATVVDPTVTPEVFYDFIGAFPPTHWTRHNGELNENTVLTHGTFWVHTRFGNDNTLPELNATKMNLWGSLRSGWIISPPIDLGDGSANYSLHFDAAVTNSNINLPGEFGLNQFFAVVISTDGGQTWVPSNILQQWDANNSISHQGEAFSFDLSEYSNVIKIGFYGQSRPGGGSVDVHVTNFGVSELIYHDVSISVKDGEGNDIDDAVVTLGETTLSQAPYVFENLLPGQYDYTVGKFGYQTVSGQLNVDGDIEFDVILQEDFTASFSVTDGNDPIQEALVEVFGIDNGLLVSGLTDSLGGVEFLINEGTYTYNVTKLFYTPVSGQTLTITDEDVDVDVVLSVPAPLALPFLEDFNDQQLPESWFIENLDDHQSVDTWKFVANLNNNTIDGTPFTIIDSDAAGETAGILNSFLYTPALDAESVDGVLILSFEHYYRHTGADSFGKIEVWNGTQWVTLANYTSTQGSWTSPALFSMDISAYANDNLRVRFHYSDGGAWAWYWAIDNVVVEALSLYSLNLEVNPEGWGTVTGAGQYPAGAVVEVTATANPGYQFVNWTDSEGEEVSTLPVHTITMPEEDLALVANFGQVTYTLTLEANPETGGVVSSGGIYPEGEIVEIAATPAEGFEFVNWLKGDEVVSTESSFNYTMPAEDVTLTANFEQITYSLALDANPEQGGTLAGEGDYAQGAQVEISAVPAANYEFISWKDSDGNEISSEPEFTFTMPAENVVLTAFFNPITYILTLEANPAEGGSVSGEGDYTQGEQVPVTATAAEGFEFTHWTDTEGNEISDQSNFTFTMPDEEVTLIAHFTEITFTLTLQINPAEGGTVSGSGDYSEGTEVALSATPAHNFVFVNWTDSEGIEVANLPDFNFIMPAEHTTLIANFDLVDNVIELETLELNLFPNPAQNYFSIIANDIIQHVTISDITGRIMYDEPSNSDDIRINAGLVPGIYLVRVYTLKGITVRKLQIKE